MIENIQKQHLEATGSKLNVFEEPRQEIARECTKITLQVIIDTLKEAQNSEDFELYSFNKIDELEQHLKELE